MPQRRAPTSAREKPSGWTSVDADAVVVAGDGFTASLLPELAPRGRGDAWAGARDRAARGASVRAAALRARRLRLLAPAPRRAARDRRHARRLAGDRGDVGRADDGADPGSPRHARLGARRSTAHRHAPLGGHLGHDTRPRAARRAVPGRDSVWVAGGYSGHGNALGLACGDLVARAMLGEQPPELELFDPARFVGLEREARQAGVVACRLERGEGDREILDRETGRVERRDLVVVARDRAAVPASTSPSCGHVLPRDEARPRPRGPARRRGSPAPSRRRRDVRARAPRPEASALPGPSAPISETCWPGRSAPSPRSTSFPGVTVTSRSAASACSSDGATSAPSSSATRRARRSSTSQRLTARPRARNVRAAACPFTPVADDRSRRGVRAPERLRREHRRRTGAQRGHRRGVEHRAQLPVLGVRDEHDARHGREALRRVAGKRGHPLQKRMPAAERRHRAEVARRVVRHVHLRRHRPLAARVRDERLAYRLDGALR